MKFKKITFKSIFKLKMKMKMKKNKKNKVRKKEFRNKF